MFWFITLPILVILVIEVLCHFMITKISHHNIMAKSQELIPEIDSNSIIILGDSRLEWGIKTQNITNKGGCVINLAMPGSNGLDIVKYLINNKIYPKTIIMGFTPNYGRYNNHNLDEIDISKINLYKNSLKYWLIQNSYIYDKESIILFLEGKEPYFINHKYDEYGNVIVEENGYFNKRIKHQLKMYKRWSLEFNKNYFDIYIKNLSSLIFKLKGKTNVYGLYMPVSDTLFSLEKNYYDKYTTSNSFEYYMDFSNFIPNNDSTYYYDGSHLNAEYAYEFTDILNQNLIMLTNTNK